MNSTKEKILDKTYRDYLDLMMYDFPIEKMSELVANDVTGFGSTQDEKFREIQRLRQMVIDQRVQGAGIEMQWQQTPIHRRISPEQDTAIYTDELLLSMELPEGKHIIPLRLSSVFEYYGNTWKLVHIHGSMGADTSEGDTWHKDEWKKKNEELQRLVDEKTAELKKQNGELEIEAALEKVRSRSLAMHHTSELQDVINTVHQQLKSLNIAITGGAFIAINEENKTEVNCWGAGGTADYVERVHIPFYDHPIYSGLIEGINKGPGFYTEEFTNEEKLKFFNHLFKHPPYTEAPSERKKEIMSRPGGYTRCCAVSKYTSIFIINHHGRKFSEDEKDVLKRFGKVFEQSYTRFLDLQKAEVQAREAQIEASLERVRAQSMAMHKSTELVEVVRMLDKEISGLGIEINGSQIVTDFENREKGVNSWYARDGQKFLEKFHVPNSDHPQPNRFWEARKNEINFYTEKYSKAEKDSYFRWLYKYSDFGRLPKERQEFVYKAPGWVRASVHCRNSIMIFQRLNLTKFTKEEEEIFKRFGKVFEQAYTRFLDLQKAEEQAREAQIEAALERLRARSMGMHHSRELIEVVRLLEKEVRGLGIQFVAGTQIITDFSDPKKGVIDWIAVEGRDYLEKFHIPYLDHPIMDNAFQAVQDGKNFYKEKYSKTEKNRFFRLLFKYSDFKRTPVERQKFILEAPGYARSVVVNKNSILVFQRYQSNEFGEEENGIFKRFGVVFDQSYTRFLDLQKAEVQAREAQIEAALERVRSKSLGMQKSEELQNVVSVVFEQLQGLDFALDGAAFIATRIEEFKGFDFWMEDKITKPARFRLPYFDAPSINDFYDAWDDKKDFVSKIYGIEKNIWFEHAFENTDLKIVPQDRKEWILAQTHLTQAFAIQKNSMIGIHAHHAKTLSDQEIDILKRFSKVFEQAYTRFLDLQNAEKQAREAEIEISLERVRAKAMAMRSSKDIPDATLIVFNELSKLGIELFRAGILIFNETPVVDLWSTPLSPDTKTADKVITGTLDTRIHPLLDGIYKAWKDHKDYYSYTLEKQEVESYYNLLKESPGYKFPKIDQYNHRQINHEFFFKEGAIFGYTKNDLTAAEIDIFQRFTKVFSLTYRRYLDIQQAEMQAKEALKQASLDRIRGEIASMRTSEDLNRITPVIWRELQALEVPFIRCGVFIVNETEQKVEVYLSTPEGKALAALNLSFNANDLTKNTLEHWRKKRLFHTHWTSKEFIEWTRSMMELGQVKNARSYQGSASVPESLHLHFVPFKQGMLYVGDKEKLSLEKTELVKTLAEAFSIAYARYEDFKNLEAAKNQIEKTLTELKATQAQLIQSEKMASLGALTAGIAHEIQNPLNFVNNFSEVSNELIDEMKEELAKGDLDEAIEIAGDIKQNLDKINHHGKRAESIVKGMLLHSRGSSGKAEPTDLNALVNEYLRLSYHGFRAKDKSFNADFKLEADESLPKIEVVPQDIGRVFLNLLNNAFYAVDQRAKEKPAGYKPMVSISTARENGLAVIRVKDNGPGIPDSIKEKIFQPFFTTKPTGQGTGLGLSLSYDIVKAHGGTLEITSADKNGTEFSINLPIQS
ncbi:ATP-binding protein [Maribellus sediminis]|uniref:ATP-binding protein n=1 Tax=Maribellus sediminis TaxID=2696285 RepID=UPI00143002FF|nr:ATP-binding protein [Maribellus sediminis]